VGILKHGLKQIETDNTLFEDIKALILESALLPILEAALRSGSLLEIAKETVLFNAYLDLVM
jgi:hypothetical protein